MLADGIKFATGFFMVLGKNVIGRQVDKCSIAVPESKVWLKGVSHI